MLGFILVTTVIVLYRGHRLGVNNVYVLQDQSHFLEMVDDDSFRTSVTYRTPFIESADDRPEERDQSAAVSVADATGILDILERLLHFFDDENYNPATPPFNEIESINGENRLLVTPETVIDHSSDRRTLGYTGQRKIVVDRDGNMTIAYRREYQGSLQIFLSELRKLDEGYVLSRATQPLSIGMLGITQRVPAITIDENNLIHVVWYGSDNDEYPARRQIHTTRTKSSRSHWEENTIVSYVEGYTSDNEYWQEHPTVTLGEYDDLFVVWEGKDTDNEKPQVKFSRSLNGGEEWLDWENVHPSTSYTYSRPAIVFTDRDSTLHLFAYSSEGVESGTNQIQYSYSLDLGFTWSPWNVVSSGEFDARHISATVVNGVPTITYRTQTRPDGPTQVITQQVNRENISSPTVFFPSGNYQFFPSITAITDSGQICVAWIEENTSADFPNEDPTDGDIFFGCKRIGDTEAVVFNITPTGSHLYPVLPATAPASEIPLVYYDDEEQAIILRLLSLMSP